MLKLHGVFNLTLHRMFWRYMADNKIYHKEEAIFHAYRNKFFTKEEVLELLDSRHLCLACSFDEYNMQIYNQLHKTANRSYCKYCPFHVGHIPSRMLNAIPPRWRNRTIPGLSDYCLDGLFSYFIFLREKYDTFLSICYSDDGYVPLYLRNLSCIEIDGKIKFKDRSKETDTFLKNEARKLEHGLSIICRTIANLPVRQDCMLEVK